jgi:hypothetical protein
MNEFLNQSLIFFYAISFLLCYSIHASKFSGKELAMTDADKIRIHAREKYVVPARNRKEMRFSIRAGNVVGELGMRGSTPAVCQALKGPKFLQGNNLRLLEVSGPKSGQSTTVVYTYEFIDTKPSSAPREDPWIRLRGALKDIFAELGGGEAYLRAERENFYPPKEGK